MGCALKAIVGALSRREDEGGQAVVVCEELHLLYIGFGSLGMAEASGRPVGGQPAESWLTI